MNKEGKNLKIAGIRSGMIGDMIMCLPVLNYLELIYPNSYKYWIIGRRFSQAAPLFLNQKLIDKIYILETPEKVSTKKDIELFKNSDLCINVTPDHPDGMPCVDNFWWNNYTLCEESFRMTGFPVEEYRKLPIELQKPKLERWFDLDKKENTIGLWLTAAYGKEPGRSPSKTWITHLITKLLKSNYKVIRFGHPNDPQLPCEWAMYYDAYKDLRYLSFMDQIKLSLDCKLCINTDSGSGWVLGAYGQKQISLLTNHAPNHVENIYSFAPENYLNNNINLHSFGGCDNISHDQVIESIDKLK